MKNIILTGFMGSGKTEVGKRLAQRLGYAFLDTDKLIEEKTGKSISEIFREEGESSFRELETEVIKNLSGITGYIISTGGGIVIREENILSLKNIGLVIWLKTSPETIINRISSETHRPLLNVDNPLEQIKKLLSIREQFYSKADVSIDTDGLEVDEVVKVILNLETL
jgi:shikimate kinase